MSIAERAGFSPARLQTFDRVLKEKYVDAGAAPCVLAHIWRGGELVHTTMAGFMDIERNIPMREDAIFRIYSMTKPITAVALLMLMEEGRIDLEDDVDDVIPSWKDLGVYAGGMPGSFRTTRPKRAMRIVDLATHTSGLTYNWMNSSYVDAAYREPDIWASKGLGALVERLAEIPLDFSPGEFWNYSVGMDVLGYIVEKVSGMTFGAFLRTRLFAPLGMTDTGFYCPPDKIGRLTTCYESKDGKLTVEDDARASRFVAPARLEGGGGALVSTANDYMRFCRMLLNGGSLDGARVLSPTSVAMLGANMLPGGRTIREMSFQDRHASWRLDGDGQSLCCAVTLGLGQKHGYGSPGDFYWSGAAMTQFWVDPAEDLAVVFMTQVTQSPGHAKTQGVLRPLVYGAMTERRSDLVA